MKSSSHRWDRCRPIQFRLNQIRFRWFRDYNVKQLSDYSQQSKRFAYEKSCERRPLWEESVIEGESEKKLKRYLEWGIYGTAVNNKWVMKNWWNITEGHWSNRNEAYLVFILRRRTCFLNETWECYSGISHTKQGFRTTALAKCGW